MRVAIGLDVGGTKTAAALVDVRGQVVSSVVCPTPAGEGARAVLETACAAAAEMADSARDQGVRVLGCGAGVAGVVDRSGVISHATDALPGWAGADVAGALESATGVAVKVVNDVHALALGEARFGAAAGARSALVVALGTGIGGAVVHDGELVVGRTGSAGSLGHVPVDGGEHRRCPCGAPDHLEAYASGPAIVARYREQGGVGERLPDVVTRARAGEALARAVLADAGRWTGRAVAGAVNLLDPDVVVLGGGVMNAGALLLEPLRDKLARHALPGPRTVPVLAADLLPQGNVVGAACLVLPRTLAEDGIDL